MNALLARITIDPEVCGGSWPQGENICSGEVLPAGLTHRRPNSE
jgi:hypothetical protein